MISARKETGRVLVRAFDRLNLAVSQRRLPERDVGMLEKELF